MEYHEMAKEKEKEKDRGNVRRVGHTVYFSDRITYESAHTLNVLLRQCESDILEDVKDAEDYMRKGKVKNVNVLVEPKPIILVLTTNGGLVHAAFSVVDTIESMKVPVNTVVSGYVASAGTLISLAGNKRFMTPNSFMMCHEIRSGFWGRYSDVRVEHENITKLMAHIIEYYCTKTKITKERMADMLRTDNDLNAKECLDIGLIDKIE